MRASSRFLERPGRQRVACATRSPHVRRATPAKIRPRGRMLSAQTSSCVAPCVHAQGATAQQQLPPPAAASRTTCCLLLRQCGGVCARTPMILHPVHRLREATLCSPQQRRPASRSPRGISSGGTSDGPNHAPGGAAGRCCSHEKSAGPQSSGHHRRRADVPRRLIAVC